MSSAPRKSVDRCCFQQIGTPRMSLPSVNSGRGSSAEEFSEKIKLDLARLRKIGQSANIKLE